MQKQRKILIFMAFIIFVVASFLVLFSKNSYKTELIDRHDGIEVSNKKIQQVNAELEVDKYRRQRVNTILNRQGNDINVSILSLLNTQEATKIQFQVTAIEDVYVVMYEGEEAFVPDGYFPKVPDRYLKDNNFYIVRDFFHDPFFKYNLVLFETPFSWYMKRIRSGESAKVEMYLRKPFQEHIAYLGRLDKLTTVDDVDTIASLAVSYIRADFVDNAKDLRLFSVERVKYMGNEYIRTNGWGEELQKYAIVDVDLSK